MRKDRADQLKPTDYFFLSPWIITLLVFWLFPVIASLILSFTDFQLLGASAHFVGFQNFRELFQDQGFRRSVINTIVFTIGTLPFTTAFALLLATLLNGKLPFKSFFQSVYF